MKAAPVYSTERNGSLRIDVRRYADGRYGFDYTPPGTMDRIKVRLNEPKVARSRALEILTAGDGGRLAPHEKSEYAEFLQWKAQRRAAKPVPELVEEFITAKERKGVSEAHMEGLKYLRTFAKSVTGNVAEVPAADVVAFIDAQKVGPRRWNNIRNIIVALWRYARAQTMLPAEKTPVELIEKRRVKVVVQTYSPDELKKLLAVTQARWLPCFVLGAFAGIRPEELAPKRHYKKPGLRWEDVNWAKRKIDVPAAVSKTGRRRFPPLLPAALAYLSDYRKLTGNIAPVTGSWHEEVERVAVAAGIKWKPDGLRHSFASYRLAVVPDLPALALEMGNSPDMIYRHYLDLKHEDEGRAWFAIRPKRARNIVTMAA